MLAAVVASVILKAPGIPDDIPVDFGSKVLFRRINIPSFYGFVSSQVEATNRYPPLVSAATRLLLHDGVDLRDMDKDDEHRAYRNYLYKMYLPLASQTQFVEAGVKEARNVSPTDRSEPLRSAYAVARSARVHSIDSLRVLKSAKRIEALINSAIQHHDDHEALKAPNPIAYKARVAEIASMMREEHFQQERVDKLQTNALGKLNKNRKENAL